MHKKARIFFLLLGFLLIVLASYLLVTKVNANPLYKVGQKLDSLNGVFVYYNGGTDHVEADEKAKDGYDIGLEYQCEEFVKRYYLEHYKHEMPDASGNAFELFDKNLKDGELNFGRNLVQFSNPSLSKPQVGDIIVIDKNVINPYGHAAIISLVTDKYIEIIQQNPGAFISTRAKFKYSITNGTCWVHHHKLLGWLRKK